MPVALSSLVSPRDGCAEYYVEQYIGMSIEEYTSELPAGTTRINFVLTGATIPLPRNFDKLFGSDIALNVAFMLELDDEDTDALIAFVDVTSVSGCASGSTSPTGGRRLLAYEHSGPLTLVAFILGNVTTAVPSLEVLLNNTSNGNVTGTASVGERLATLLEERVVAGTFTTASAQINITSLTSTTDLVPPSSSTGTFNSGDISTSSDYWTASRIAGVTIGCAIAFLLMIAALICAFSRTRESSQNKNTGSDLPLYMTGINHMHAV